MLDGYDAGQINGIRSARLLAEKGFSAGRIILEPGQDPDSLLFTLVNEVYITYIKRLTHFCRLEIYETDLLRQIKRILANLPLALMIEERTDLFVKIIPLRKRLDKVTRLLAHSPVLKADWLLG